jgi:hypothetical protein
MDGGKPAVHEQCFGRRRAKSLPLRQPQRRGEVTCELGKRNELVTTNSAIISWSTHPFAEITHRVLRSSVTWSYERLGLHTSALALRYALPHVAFCASCLRKMNSNLCQGMPCTIGWRRREQLTPFACTYC